MNYQRIYDEIIERAKLRGLNKKLLNYYTERHHIIPKCLNGTNSKSNLVLLTGREHYLCHYLLWKSNNDNTDLFNAYYMMTHCKNEKRNYKITSKQYEILRIENSKFRKMFTHSESTKYKMREHRKFSNNGNAISCEIFGIKFECIKDAIKYAKESLNLKSSDAHLYFADSTNLNFIKNKELKCKNGYKILIKSNDIICTMRECFIYYKNNINDDISFGQFKNSILNNEYNDYFEILQHYKINDDALNKMKNAVKLQMVKNNPFKNKKHNINTKETISRKAKERYKLNPNRSSGILNSYSKPCKVYDKIFETKGNAFNYCIKVLNLKYNDIIKNFNDDLNDDFVYLKKDNKNEAIS